MDVTRQVIDSIKDQAFISSDPGGDEELDQDLGLDSIDCMELVMILEERLDIDVPNEAADRVRTVKDCVELVDNLVNGVGI